MLAGGRFIQCHPWQHQGHLWGSRLLAANQQSLPKYSSQAFTGGRCARLPHFPAHRQAGSSRGPGRRCSAAPGSSVCWPCSPRRCSCREKAAARLRPGASAVPSRGQHWTLTPCRRARSRGQRACAEIPRCPDRSSPAGRIGQGLPQSQAVCLILPREGSWLPARVHKRASWPPGSQSTPVPPTQEKPPAGRNEPCLTAPGSLDAARGTRSCATGQEMLCGEGKLGGRPSGMGMD